MILVIYGTLLVVHGLTLFIFIRVFLALSNLSSGYVTIPSATTEALESAPDELQLIHHNVQGLISKSIEMAHWLDICETLPSTTYIVPC